MPTNRICIRHFLKSAVALEQPLLTRGFSSATAPERKIPSNLTIDPRSSFAPKSSSKPKIHPKPVVDDDEDEERIENEVDGEGDDALAADEYDDEDGEAKDLDVDRRRGLLLVNLGHSWTKSRKSWLN